MSLEGAIAANRFGLGARPGEIARASDNPKAWLMAQMSGPAPQLVPLDGGPFPNAGKLVGEEDAYKVAKFMAKGNKVTRKKDEEKAKLKMADNAKPPADDMDAGDAADAKHKGGGGDGVERIRKIEYASEMASRFALGFTTDRPFAERLVRFWSNHFTVSAKKKKVTLFAGDFEREAIRPNINGTFEDMLFAVVMHPAMQIYLDNWRSIGPNSKAGKNNGKGLNENLGRELMELYTLGVDGGYTQADVIAMAKLLTGFGLYDEHANGFGFYPERHEPGPITLRGKVYQAGWDGSVAAIKDLAHDPATARNIARKLAAHFISDNPPRESVARLEKTFNDTHGNLHALAQAIVNEPAAWSAEQKKMRTPIEYVTAAMRLSGWPQTRDMDHQRNHLKRLLASVRVMGEVPFGAPSPKGWPDDADSWNGADAMLGRIQWAKDFGSDLPASINASAAAEMALGPQLRPATKSAMASASSQNEAFALLLASPEFQRR
ncbi:MAG TPA: DUF1800 domain-containing protein [Rhizomicrobium sp.]|nr:DUF1800 domain-containing protein [Rhizomicrobium sp.]